MKNKVKVKYINYGLASTIKDSKGKEYIEVNKALNQHPVLKRYVMEHELKHLEADFKRDMTNDFKTSFSGELLKEFIIFYFTHPSAWRQLLPIDFHRIKNKKEDYYEIRVNWFMLIFWIIVLAIVSWGFYLGGF